MFFSQYIKKSCNAVRNCNAIHFACVIKDSFSLECCGGFYNMNQKNKRLHAIEWESPGSLAPNGRHLVCFSLHCA